MVLILVLNFAGYIFSICVGLNKIYIYGVISSPIFVELYILLWGGIMYTYRGYIMSTFVGSYHVHGCGIISWWHLWGCILSTLCEVVACPLLLGLYHAYFCGVISCLLLWGYIMVTFVGLYNVHFCEVVAYSLCGVISCPPLWGNSMSTFVR